MGVGRRRDLFRRRFRPRFLFAGGDVLALLNLPTKIDGEGAGLRQRNIGIMAYRVFTPFAAKAVVQHPGRCSAFRHGERQATAIGLADLPCPLSSTP